MGALIMDTHNTSCTNKGCGKDMYFEKGKFMYRCGNTEFQLCDNCKHANTGEEKEEKNAFEQAEYESSGEYFYATQ